MRVEMDEYGTIQIYSQQPDQSLRLRPKDAGYEPAVELYYFAKEKLSLNGVTDEE